MPCKTCHFNICRCDDLASQIPPGLGGNTPQCWPMYSDALAVHPKQIEQAMARNKKYGVTGVSYNPKDGRAIIEDRGARRDLMRLEGVHDKHGGYGDDHASASPLPPLPETPITDAPVVSEMKERKRAK